MEREWRGTIARVVVDAPAPRVWHMLTEPEGLRAWLCDEATFETAGPSLRPGDRFAFRYWYIENRGTFAEVYPPSRLVLNNHYATALPDGTPLAADLTTTYALEPVADGTRLSVIVLGYPDDELGEYMRDGMGFTWKKMLLNLKSVVEFGHDLRGALFAVPRIGVLNATIHRSRYDEAGVREGNFVLAVLPESAAEIAGVRAGDVIATVDGRPTPSYSDYSTEMAGHRPGDRVALDVVRRGARIRLEVDLPTPRPLVPDPGAAT